MTTGEEVRVKRVIITPSPETQYEKNSMLLALYWYAVKKINSALRIFFGISKKLEVILRRICVVMEVS